MNATPGSTRPFGLLGLCARLGYAALVLLAPELALAVSPVAGLLRRPRLKPGMAMLVP